MQRGNPGSWANHVEAVEGALLLGAEIARTQGFINGTAIGAAPIVVKLFRFLKAKGSVEVGGLVSHNTGITVSDKPNIPHERGHILHTYMYI